MEQHSLKIGQVINLIQIIIELSLTANRCDECFEVCYSCSGDLVDCVEKDNHLKDNPLFLIQKCLGAFFLLRNEGRKNC